eukprot:215701-Heterocapsa_arctica.AAC.1
MATLSRPAWETSVSSAWSKMCAILTFRAGFSSGRAEVFAAAAAAGWAGDDSASGSSSTKSAQVP